MLRHFAVQIPGVRAVTDSSFAVRNEKDWGGMDYQDLMTGVSTRSSKWCVADTETNSARDGVGAMAVL